MRNGSAAAMPKGHEDFVMGSGKWPKPYDFKQSAKSTPEPKHQIQSSTASETVTREDEVPADPASGAT